MIYVLRIIYLIIIQGQALQMYKRIFVINFKDDTTIVQTTEHAM